MEINLPKISVIIPVYNGEKTIRETVQSVLNQTFTDFEIIIINDGSTDATLEVITSINDPRLKIFSYPNGNQSVSRNRGMTHAKGKYIAFLDADDLWTPDKLVAQYQALQNNPEAAVAYSWTDCIDESSQFLRPGGHITINGDAYPYLLLVNILENGSNPLIRREALAEVGEFDSSLIGGEDQDMWLRLAAKYPFVTVSKPQILYRQSANSASMNIWEQEASSRRMLEKVFQQAPEKYQYLKKPSFANIYKSFTVKAVNGYPNRSRAVIALRFIVQTIFYDPTLLKQRVTFRALLKILIIILLPASLAKSVLDKFGRLSNIGALTLLIQTDPFVK